MPGHLLRVSYAALCASKWAVTHKHISPLLQSPRVYNETGELKIVAVDCGMKNNQIRCLVERGASIKVVPWNYDFNKDEGKWGEVLSVELSFF